MSVIEIEDLGIRRGAAALQGVSLRVGEGESVAVVGDDQASLTLLVRCCGGLLRPDRGHVRVGGVDVVAADRHALLDLRRALGYVSIHGGLLANMTLRDNVELPMRYHAVAEPAEITARADALLDEAGLQGRANEPASALPAEIQAGASETWLIGGAASPAAALCAANRPALGRRRILAFTRSTRRCTSWGTRPRRRSPVSPPT